MRKPLSIAVNIEDKKIIEEFVGILEKEGIETKVYYPQHDTDAYIEAMESYNLVLCITPNTDKSIYDLANVRPSSGMETIAVFIEPTLLNRKQKEYLSSHKSIKYSEDINSLVTQLLEKLGYKFEERKLENTVKEPQSSWAETQTHEENGESLIKDKIYKQNKNDIIEPNTNNIKKENVINQKSSTNQQFNQELYRDDNINLNKQTNSYKSIIIILVLIIIIGGGIWSYTSLMKESTEEIKTEEVKIVEIIPEQYNEPRQNRIIDSESRYVSNKSNNYDWLLTRLATKNDLKNKSRSELRIMRNWIFARHGYIFKSDDLRSYFNSFSWYNPQFNDVADQLGDIELKNIEIIKKYE